MIIGFILVIIGAGICIYGNHLNNDIESQLLSVFEKGQTNPGNMFLIIGGVAVAVGVVLIVLRLIRRKK